MTSRWRPVMLLVVASTTLLGALALKRPCSGLHPYQDFGLVTYCYSDIVSLYERRGLDVGSIPYMEAFNEYPVLTGAFQWLVARSTTDLAGYFLVSALLLIAAGFLTTWAIWTVDVAWPRPLVWAAAPGLLLSGLVNWDLLAVCLAAGGWLAWRRARSGTAALLFGLGGAAKLFPAFFLPFVLVACLRRRDAAALRKVAVGATVGFAAPNLLVAAVAPDGWLATWRFHATRGPHFQSPWLALERFDALAGAVDWLPALLMLAASAWLAWRQWRLDADPLLSGSLLTVVFFLVSPVYSPQYGLLVLAILAMTRVRWGPVGLYLVADAAEQVLIYPFMIDAAERGPWVPEPIAGWAGAAITCRWIALLLIAYELNRLQSDRGRRRKPL